MAERRTKTTLLTKEIPPNRTTQEQGDLSRILSQVARRRPPAVSKALRKKNKTSRLPKHPRAGLTTPEKLSHHCNAIRRSPPPRRKGPNRGHTVRTIQRHQKLIIVEEGRVLIMTPGPSMEVQTSATTHLPNSGHIGKPPRSNHTGLAPMRRTKAESKKPKKHL